MSCVLMKIDRVRNRHGRQYDPRLCLVRLLHRRQQDARTSIHRFGHVDGGKGTFEQVGRRYGYH